VSTIPLHLQRRFEQRWAARFVAPVASAAPQVAQSQDIETMPQPPLQTTANDNQLGLAVHSISGGLVRRLSWSARH
jgi:hypothetical protein